MMMKDIIRDCDYVKTGAAGILQGGTTGPAPDIKGITYDSRKVKDGYMFVAIRGEKHDGHNFLDRAIARGAVAVVHEEEIRERFPGIQYVRVNNSRKALACLANNFYERPSESLCLIGITGTNGKTTTSYLLKSILEAAGEDVGLIGTIHYMIKGQGSPALHTTPESTEFQGLLKEMLLAGCRYVVSEISSHALAQYRVDETTFRTAIFTNLTRDHLDFHKTMDDYFHAKARLFTELLLKTGTAVINLDDASGLKLSLAIRAEEGDTGKIITYGIETKADLLAQNIVTSSEGLRFTVSFQGDTFEILSPLAGTPNVYNILAAAGAAVSLGISWEAIIQGIHKVSSIRGRFEKVETGQDFLCVVDYAHTEDALERLIQTARELLKRNSGTGTKDEAPRIITVFGCGGDRDRGKRPKMGRIASTLSDFVIITSDNPRSEEPESIIRDIEAGVIRRNYLVEPDRREAIRRAIHMGRAGDIILVAGKGHEEYQEIKGVRHRFSDRGVIEEVLKDRAGTPRES
ncbi:MAG: UDP-N-acetylmuramoyl-L-alanyl-D-glutamate--2,6-diaminopimelate ligase [Nitrospirota bacterium]